MHAALEFIVEINRRDFGALNDVKESTSTYLYVSEKNLSLSLSKKKMKNENEK